MSIQAELFTKDLDSFHIEQKHYLDASGNFLGYNAKHGIKLLKAEEHVKLRFDEKTFFKGSGSSVDDPTCAMSDPTLKGEGSYMGLSNLNFGRITQPYEIQGTHLQDLENTNMKTAKVMRDFLTAQFEGINEQIHKVYKEGELTAPIVKVIEEKEKNKMIYIQNPVCKSCQSTFEVRSVGTPIPSDYDASYCGDCQNEESLLCQGCSKYFATKGSLKRHHERKKSCKEICEKKEDLSGTRLDVPDKPYIVDWVDQILTKSISADTEKSYCKHCDVEFANKSNLNKHLSKSVACDKLAKQEFLMLLKAC